MRVLLSANLPYYPAHGGGNKVNRALLEGLARAGHEVTAVLPATGPGSRATLEEVVQGIASQGASVATYGADLQVAMNGVRIIIVKAPGRLRSCLRDEIASWNPEHVLIMSEDVSQTLLAAALEVAPERTIYVVLTTSFLPFGDQSFFPGERRTELVRRVRRVVAMSDYLASYMETHAGIRADVLRMPLLGLAPSRHTGVFGGKILMINPCQIKGISIFVELARMFPSYPFAAVPTWGASTHDLELVRAESNIQIVQPNEDIDCVFDQVSIVVMPSLWGEAFGLTCVEAMLRGIPVVASRVGGLVEAKMGTDYSIPVRPIEEFTERVDERMLAEPIVPPQDIRPWADAIHRLWSDPAEYERQSREAVAAAKRYVATATIERFAEYLARAS